MLGGTFWWLSIFVSYRRDDSESITGRLDERLREAFGDSAVFRDIDSIPLGADFAEHLESALLECDVCLAIIGRGWLTPRLLNPRDFVRLELERALQRQIPLIPVLVERANLPTESELPESLRQLVRRQGIRVDSGSDFDAHVARLVSAISEIMRTAETPAARVKDHDQASRAAPLRRLHSARFRAWLGLVGLALACGVGIPIVTMLKASSSGPVPDSEQRETRIESWCHATLLGSDSGSSPAAPMTISSNGPVFSAKFEVRYGLSCALTFDEYGDPSVLSDCQSKFDGYAPTAPMKVTCIETARLRRCSAAWTSANGLVQPNGDGHLRFQMSDRQ
jgi:hypothetical protein